jgi:hypothetical protein
MSSAKQMTHDHYRAKEPVVETFVSMVHGKPIGGWQNRPYNITRNPLGARL